LDVTIEGVAYFVKQFNVWVGLFSSGVARGPTHGWIALAGKV
jgi:hypothetical protein